MSETPWQRQRALDERYGITRVVGRCGGRPCYGNSRLTVSSVLSFVIESGQLAAMQAYPWLQEADVDRIVSWALQTPPKYRNGPARRGKRPNEGGEP